MQTDTSRYDGQPQEPDPNARYWQVTIDLGERPKTVTSMGGTAFSDGQVTEQVVQYLRGVAERIEQTGKP